MTTEEAKRTSIAISQETKNGLNSIRHPGQSYEGVIRELLEFWRKKRKPLKPHE